jgi:Asp-tRNA(Asn)/Glu-tRNA(Gln) amidotransferase A subunit family amidase
LGTDTMGSVRLPAAYCGVVGFKASFGLVSTGGTVACGYALDHVGPLTRSHRDLLLVLPVLAAYDPQCADARDVALQPALDPVRFVVAQLTPNLGLAPEVEAAYRRALDALRAAGHPLHELSLEAYDFGRARRAGLLMVEADLLAEHAADWSDPQRKANFSPELTRLMSYAEGRSAAHYAAAARVVAQAHLEVARWWAHGDVMVLPTTPQTAFAFGSPVPANQADLTSIANMAGVPALSVPLPVAEGELPLGLQFVAASGHEATLLGLNLSGVAAA